MTSESFASRLAGLRKELNLSQKMLSEKTGISLSAIGKWEAGLRNPSSDMVLFLAKYFNVSTDYLFGLED